MGRSRRLTGAAGAGVVVLTVAAVVVSDGGNEGTTAAASQATATTTIRAQDLVESEVVDGTLGYSDVRTVVNRFGGTVTWTPSAGSVVEPGRRLYEIDGRAVYLLDGSYPAYRTLQAGMTGDDVRQLERNLRRLGLDTDRAMTVDRTWDPGTTAAVKRWQSRKGMPQDGTIAKGRIAFQPGPRRVGTITQPVGSSTSGAAGGGRASPASDERGRPSRALFASMPSNQPGERDAASGPEPAAVLMTTTSTKRIVAVDLETTKQDLARDGARVSVVLPDGDSVVGTIARVGAVAQRKPTPQNEDPPATIKVTIKLKAATGLKLDQAPVDVKLEKQRARNVLVVPVTALLARAGGELAVEVRDGDRRRVVAVKTGLYTDSYVEIDGSGLRPGLKVSNAEV